MVAFSVGTSVRYGVLIWPEGKIMTSLCTSRCGVMLSYPPDVTFPTPELRLFGLTFDAVANKRINPGPLSNETLPL